MMATDIAQEELKLTAMQRVWQSNRRIGSSSSSLFDDNPKFEDVFASPHQHTSASKGPCTSPHGTTLLCSDAGIVAEALEMVQDQTQQECLLESLKPNIATTLDASTLNDFPACYTIYGLKDYQLPVAGVYVHKSIITGFKYRVRPLPSSGSQLQSLPYLFDGKALTLMSIGRGYSRRFTFEADKNCLNNNENYFWSDNRPEGFGFELGLVSEGDKFTVYDTAHEAEATVEILKLEGSQFEISSEVTNEGIVKKAKITFIGKVELYETGVAKPMPLSGTVICIKRKGAVKSEIVKIINVTIKRHRCVLTPGINTTHRRVTVRGLDIGDIPTKYTMTGIESYEIPVVGTYIDPRIIPGFCYKVRPNDRKEHLFQGRPLKLCSIGMGYAKRLTFAPDSLVEPDNYLWSDSHPDGLGLEPHAVQKGMKFSITAADQVLGEACVFRADMPQMEEKMEKVLTPSGKYAIVKYIHVDVMCHIKLATIGGGTVDNEEHFMRVYGLAVVRKEPYSNAAYVVRVENVGLDSQLNILFARTYTELIFHPIYIK